MSDNDLSEAPSSRARAVERPWARPATEVLHELSVDRQGGLDSSAIEGRRRRFGSNQMRRVARRSLLGILVGQFSSMMMLLLAAAAVVAFLMVDWVEGSAIGVVILLNAAIGFFTELRAVRSMEALYSLAEVTTRVRRDGQVREVPAAGLVVGDIVPVEGGDLVAADLRLVETSRLQANESALTGESAPVEKAVEEVPGETSLAERTSMLYKGTAITRGSGEGVVVATGLSTELGHITELVETTESTETPLEERLERLGRRLIYVTLGLSAAVAAVGLLLGRDAGVMIETAIALAVATVPEGLPIVATIALARGLWRMARSNALVKRLSAVETLGATGVILTDKTGTLTENRMELVELVLPSGTVEVDLDGGGFSREGTPVDPAGTPELEAALEVGVLCSNAELQGPPSGPDGAEDGSDVFGGRPSAVGDPMEAALLEAGLLGHLTRADALERYPELREDAFDPDSKLMATFHRTPDGQVRVAVKGAPEEVLGACTRIADGDETKPLDDAEREEWMERSETLGEDGLRLLGLAQKQTDAESESPYENLTFLGLAAFLDPPREDVKPALDQCREAGIRLVMVTGDQAGTALHVARAVGLVAEGESRPVPGSTLASPESLTEADREDCLRASVFSRVSPVQKLNLIALHQDAGNVVAMTGDGVNDAPALKRADIGVAMGQRGTQVARETADIVLKDDAFGTIVAAIRQGRAIFDNIRKFVLYLLSCNVSEVLVVAVATVANTPLPILPLQILFLNLVTDVFPALALGVGRGSPRIMARPPRPADEPILTGRHWRMIGGYGVVIMVAVLGAYAWALYGLELPSEEAVTVSFLTLALAQLWQVFNMRDPGTGLVRNDVTTNPWIWGAIALCVALLALAVYVPVLAEVMDLVRPTPVMWAGIVGFSFVPWILGQAWIGWSGRGPSTAGAPSPGHGEAGPE